MIVYNLACEHQHPFEGWFSSPADFENQRDRGLVECPVCGSKRVERKLHAPRINLGAAPETKREAVEAATQPDGEIDYDRLKVAIAGFAQQVRDNPALAVEIERPMFLLIRADRPKGRSRRG